MNLIKSLFIFLAPVWLLVIVVIGIYDSLYTKMTLMSVGVVLSALPLLIFLSYLMLFKKLARTSEHLLVVLIPSVLGYVVVLFLFLKNAEYSFVINMLLSMSAFFVTFLYIYWYSDNGRKKSGTIINHKNLPEFPLVDYNGKNLTSAQFIGKKCLIIFYRGNWCPLCVAQIDEVATNFKQFEELGVSVVFIAPQSANNTKTLAKKYKLDFKFYIDKNNKAAQQLGIVHRFGLPMGFQALGYDSDSVFPTVIAINEQGKIIYNDQTTNYRLRPEPQELISVFYEP